ncbi:hypothetical protein GALMADRAFT_158967 [Galerina marginata CBS 339.88]|uniref:TEA domain-containing protein n=1 Tax=Galerina marginata (strain CBS 339.88) TaxID=685588 RepID=A0A067SX09_GALM3|nr:hypothetical protein GALMADRAFT_158967 [Galerina marginata CBS 339.88]
MRPISPIRKRLGASSTVPQSERTGRRSYRMMPLVEVENSRTLRVRKEPVWPPICEEALLEGLRAYRPVSKTGRPLRRFTKRNVFISKFIFEATGEKRTPKQVGSRLQQISESSRDDDLKTLIRNRDFPPDQISLNLSPEPSSPTLTAVGTPSDYTDSTVSDFGSPEFLVSSIFDTSSDSSDPKTIVIPSHSPCYDNFFAHSVTLSVELITSDVAAGMAAQLGMDADITDHGTDFILSLDANHKSGEFNPSYNARHLSNIPPQSLFYQPPKLTIISPFLSSQIPYLCTFAVYFDATTLVHSEDTSLIVTQETGEYSSKSCVWCTQVLPGYWDKLSRLSSLERYTIIFDILKLPMDASEISQAKPDFSVAFNFRPTSSSDIGASPPFYSSNTFDDPPLPPTFSSFPLGSIPSTLFPDADCGRVYTWFDQASSYVLYPLAGDHSLNVPDSDVGPPYTFAQF